MTVRHLRVGLCLVILHAGAPHADQTSLPPILISAGRTTTQAIDIPTSAIVISRAQIDDSGARDLAELLRRVASVHVSDGNGDGSNASIDMRGFGSAAASNVAVLIDGRKINPATDTASLYLNSIDLAQVEQVEIIEGSAGTLYGNQAVGGLINVITRRPAQRSRQLRVGAGSYAAWEALAGISERLADAVRVSLQAHRHDSDNYRDDNASRMQRFDARVELDHGTGHSYVDLLLLDDYAQTPGALFAAELDDDRRQAAFSGDYLDTESRVLTVGTRQDLGEHWRLEGELAWRDDDREFVQSFRFFPGSRSTQDRDSVEFTPRLVGRYGDTRYTLGLDYLATDYQLQTAFGLQANDQTIGAVYAQLTHALSPAVSMTAGLRHARVENDIDAGGADASLDDDVTVGSLGFVYRPDSAWRLFLRADQNYRFAKVDEHTNVVFGQPVGLDNQTGVSYETGVDYHGNGFNVAARAFQLRLKDEISFDAATFANVNLPRSRRNGLALSGDLTLTPGLLVGAGYEYIDAEITSGSHDGSEVPLVPAHKASLYLEYRPQMATLLRLDVEYVGEQYLGSDFANTSPPLDAHTVVNLVAHQDVGNWRFTARVNNLFDELYSETGAASFAGDGYNPAPERNFWIGASYHFED